MYLTFDSFGLFQQPIGEFEVVIHPPFRCPFDVSGIDIETTPKPLENSIMVLPDFLHQQFLFWGSHCYKDNIGFLLQISVISTCLSSSFLK